MSQLSLSHLIDLPTFSWEQTTTHIFAHLKLPKDANKRLIDVKFETKSVKIYIKDEIYFEAGLAEEIDNKDFNSCWRYSGSSSPMVILEMAKKERGSDWYFIFDKPLSEEEIPELIKHDVESAKNREEEDRKAIQDTLKYEEVEVEEEIEEEVEVDEKEEGQEKETTKESQDQQNEEETTTPENTQDKTSDENKNPESQEQNPSTQEEEEAEEDQDKSSKEESKEEAENTNEEGETQQQENKTESQEEPQEKEEQQNENEDESKKESEENTKFETEEIKENEEAEKTESSTDEKETKAEETEQKPKTKTIKKTIKTTKRVPKETKEGDGSDEYKIGLDYETNNDFMKAAHYYEEAAERGHLDARIKLSEIYQSAKFGKPNLEKAMYFVRLSAFDNGFRDSLFQLGFAAHHGRGGAQKSLTEARYYYTLASLKGEPLSMFYLGILYSEGGDGIIKNISKSIQWMNLSMQRGFAAAAYKLAFLLINYKRDTEDLSCALECLKIANSWDPDNYKIPPHLEDKIRSAIAASRDKERKKELGESSEEENKQSSVKSKKSKKEEEEETESAEDTDKSVVASNPNQSNWGSVLVLAGVALSLVYLWRRYK